MHAITRFTAPLGDLDNFKIFDDFWQDQSDINWIDTITDTGTVAMGDSVNGVAVLTPSDGTVADNDEAYIASPNENFKYVLEKPFLGKARIQFTEVTATIANVAFGFQNAVGANSIIDDGAGLKVSGSCLGIYKVDGSAVWKCVSACNGVATVSTSSGVGSAAVAATWYVLEIECNHSTATEMQVSFKVDGQILRDSSGRQITHQVPIASATEMQIFAGIKLGAITNNDTLSVDYIYGGMVR